MPNHAPVQRQRGIALITALLVVAIATVIAVEIAARERLDIRRTQNLIASGQAYDLAVAAETWVLDILKTDLEDKNNPNTDSFQDNWAQPIMIPPFEGAQIGMQIEDLQGRFNVNNLSQLSVPGQQGQQPVPPLQQRLQNPNYRIFKQLIDNLRAEHQIELQIPTDNLISALIDWLDPDLLQTDPGGAEDSYYLGLDPPRRTANRPMISTSELLLVSGFTPELVRLLLPHITALPTDEATININTATPEILRALMPGNDQTIDRLVRERSDQTAKPWESVGEFIQTVGGTFPEDGLGVSSGYFAVYSEATLGPARVRLQSMIGRGNNGLQVLRRTRGTL